MVSITHNQALCALSTVQLFTQYVHNTVSPELSDPEAEKECKVSVIPCTTTASSNDAAEIPPLLAAENVSQSNRSNINNTSPPYQLNPVVDDNGLNRCKIKLIKAEELSFDEKCPIILPPMSKLRGGGSEYSRPFDSKILCPRRSKSGKKSCISLPRSY